MKKTLTSGQQFKEGICINRSLMALINMTKRIHQKYNGHRENKLTQFLKNSLGGNSFTLMIACVSPADKYLYTTFYFNTYYLLTINLFYYTDQNLEESINTLKYAENVQKIKNRPTRHIFKSESTPASSASTSTYENKIKVLQEEKGKYLKIIFHHSREIQNQLKVLANVDAKQHLWADFLEIANKNRTSDYLENSHENSAPNNSNGEMVSRDLFHFNINDTKGRKLKIGVNKEFFAALIPSNI
ncbi:kinesin-related protein 8-like [Formica exsecta]|uniref:kinesin-related protein 8-like n=1 Tax=Formica exsecta TaxID=72781 RepID=UPI00114370D0|nr:kinesin-related protein 8-like [Formica exsecta]